MLEMGHGAWGMGMYIREIKHPIFNEFISLQCILLDGVVIESSWYTLGVRHKGAIVVGTDEQ